MLAVRTVTSNPGTADDRGRLIEAHKLHLRGAPFKIVLSGPTFDDAGEQNGAIIVAEVDSLDQLKRFSDRDPFVISGVYRQVIVSRWSATIDNR